MANVGYQRRGEIKLVLIYAHMPDVTFRSRNCEGGSHTMPMSPMPCDADILEMRFLVWQTTYEDELFNFLKLTPHWTESLRQQAKVLGYSPESHAVVHRIRGRIDTMLDDAVSRMPGWLAGRCETIYDINLRGM